MSSEFEKKPAPRKEPGKWKQALGKLGHSLGHNWGWKISSLLLAVALWAGLISQDPTLTREKTFYKVEITVTGADTLRRNGLIVVGGLSDELPEVRMKVDVPQKEYDNVTASTYIPRLDLSRIRATGVQEVRITGTSTSAYGTIKEFSPSTVEVEVEEYINRYRIPVNVEIQGDYPEGVYSDPPTVDPPTVAVSGPKSLVDQVARAVAIFDPTVLSAQTDYVSTSVPFRLVGRDGKAIESDLIQVTSESVILDNVIVEQKLYPTRTVELSPTGLTSGEPAAGYKLDSITVTPRSLTIAALDEDILKELDLAYLEGAVSLDGRSESFTESVRIRKPSEVKSMSCDSVTVAVEISPIYTEKTFENVKISAIGQDASVNATLGTNRASIMVEGPQLWLGSLKSAAITLYVDLSGLTTPGVYTLPVRASIEGAGDESYTFVSTPSSVQVTLDGKK